MIASEGYGELIGGAQREDDLGALEHRIAEHELPRESFEWFLDLRRFGSAGQVRGAMIALKFGKLQLLQTARGETPLLLMDDFDSDLDETRISALADFLHQGGFQTLVATSKEAQVSRIDVSFMKLRMDDGVARAA